MIATEKRKIRQFKLSSGFGLDYLTLVTWLPDDARLKPGVYLTLKGGDGIRWQVEKVYKTQKYVNEIESTWKAGGL